jgi:NADH-ubiquinone oxidoreductase chain 1
LGNELVLFIGFVGVAFGFVWVRGTLPRFRYDKLIYLAWKSFLPFSLYSLIFFSSLLRLQI